MDVETGAQDKPSTADEPLKVEEGETATASINDAVRSNTPQSALLERNKPDRSSQKRRSNVAGLYVSSVASYDKKGKLQ